MAKKTAMYDLSLSEWEALLLRWGQPHYRAGQIWNWLYHKLAITPDDMTSLPKSLRQQLADGVCWDTPQLLAQQESMDGETCKDLLAMSDGAQVEVVLMRYINRRSACISTQVGCAVGCKFCATGQMGFQRNLTAGEIIAQVLHVARELRSQGQKLSNIVLMGMGEPLLNYRHTLTALRRLMHPDGFQMGQRRITLSTAGIAPQIQRLADEGLQINLAVSLHAATDDLRNELMPINRKYNLDTLFSAVQRYIEHTNRRVTFEWVMIDRVNDTREQAEALAARLGGMLAHVNLIPLNPTPNYAGRPSTAEALESFAQVLEKRHIPHTTRLRRGLDINAGCGQLRSLYQKGATHGT